MFDTLLDSGFRVVVTGNCEGSTVLFDSVVDGSDDVVVGGSVVSVLGILVDLVTVVCSVLVIVVDGRGVVVDLPLDVESMIGVVSSVSGVDAVVAKTTFAQIEIPRERIIDSIFIFLRYFYSEAFFFTCRCFLAHSQIYCKRITK